MSQAQVRLGPSAAVDAFGQHSRTEEREFNISTGVEASKTIVCPFCGTSLVKSESPGRCSKCGYGFITPDASQTNSLRHLTAIDRSVKSIKAVLYSG